MIRLFTIAFVIQCLTPGVLFARENPQVNGIKEAPGYLLMEEVKKEEDLERSEVKPEMGPTTGVVENMDVNVSGTVRDTNGEPIPGVTVSVAGTTIGTTTDLDGKYSLSLPEGSTLVFSFIGFISQSIPIGDRSVLEVVLAEDMQNLEEVVVIGYGTQKKAEVTSAVSSVSEDETRVSMQWPTSLKDEVRTPTGTLQIRGATAKTRPTIRMPG